MSGAAQLLFLYDSVCKGNVLLSGFSKGCRRDAARCKQHKPSGLIIAPISPFAGIVLVHMATSELGMLQVQNATLRGLGVDAACFFLPHCFRQARRDVNICLECFPFFLIVASLYTVGNTSNSSDVYDEI